MDREQKYCRKNRECWLQSYQHKDEQNEINHDRKSGQNKVRKYETDENKGDWWAEDAD